MLLPARDKLVLTDSLLFEFWFRGRGVLDEFRRKSIGLLKGSCAPLVGVSHWRSVDTARIPRARFFSLRGTGVSGKAGIDPIEYSLQLSLPIAQTDRMLRQNVFFILPAHVGFVFLFSEGGPRTTTEA